MNHLPIASLTTLTASQFYLNVSFGTDPFEAQQRSVDHTKVSSEKNLNRVIPEQGSAEKEFDIPIENSERAKKNRQNERGHALNNPFSRGQDPEESECDVVNSISDRERKHNLESIYREQIQGGMGESARPSP